MTDQSDQERSEQEDLMANGPVSRGASNKSAPMNKNNPGPLTKKRSKNQKQSSDYNKMVQTERSGAQVGSGMGTDQKPGTPGGGTLPTEREHGSTTGGRLTTNSTAGAGGSSGGTVQLEGILSIADGARALIVFAYYRIDSSEITPSNMSILAAMCRSEGLSTLRVNLLTPEDEELDKTTMFFRENISVLHQRVIGIVNWLIENVNTHSIGFGYFGVGVCASAMLAASAVRPDAVNAIVAVSPSFELVNSYLPRIVAPTLIIAPEKDAQALTMYRTSLSEIASDTNLDIVRLARERGLANTLEIIPDVQNAFENNQSSKKVGDLTTGWFTHYL